MASLAPIYVYGLPGDIGGAATELWHTLKLWRSLDLDIILYPTAPVDPAWLDTVKAIGCGVSTAIAGGSTVVGFCNADFRHDTEALRSIGCRTINVPCMNWLSPRECNSVLSDRYVFQSNYQLCEILPKLQLFGFKCEHARLIRGAFDPTEFPFNPLPHNPGEPFIIGRLSRAECCKTKCPAYDKYPKDLWAQYADLYRPLKARVMGWSDALAKHCGNPPEWAECLPQGAETSRAFLSKIHCLVPGLGCCAENWPRVGLEAMAAGVPIVAEAKGGWLEMMLPFSGVKTLLEQSMVVSMLAESESHRMDLIECQRTVCADIADPIRIGKQWLSLFEELASME